MKSHVLHRYFLATPESYVGHFYFHSVQEAKKVVPGSTVVLPAPVDVTIHQISSILFESHSLPDVSINYILAVLRQHSELIEDYEEESDL